MPDEVVVPTPQLEDPSKPVKCKRCENQPDEISSVSDDPRKRYEQIEALKAKPPKHQKTRPIASWRTNNKIYYHCVKCENRWKYPPDPPMPPTETEPL